MRSRIRRVSVAAAVVTAMLVIAPAAPAAETDTGQEPDLHSAVANVPEDFAWGVASSGFQIEGHFPDSNWSRYVEQSTAAIKDPYRNSVDFRNHYPADIRRAAQLGVDTFRFSIEWARVQPQPGVIDESALAYYDDVVRRVKEAGMTPMITLTHFVHPGWVADQGAWANRATVTDWLEFADIVVRRYQDDGARWITFNEPKIYAQHEVSNGGISVFEVPAMLDNLIKAHRRGYDMIHRIDPDAKVSSNVAYLPPPLRLIGDMAFLDHVADKLDYLGMDYYYGLSLDNLSAAHAAAGNFAKVKPQPSGLYHALKDYHRKYPDLPIYIVENGMPTNNGEPRQDGYTRSQHLSDHLYWMQRAMAEGVPVIGYNYWSLTDNYEWGSYQSRFGLYTVDVLDDPELQRHPTQAVATYQQVTERGSVPQDYIPVKKPAWCAFADLSTCLFPPDTG